MFYLDHEEQVKFVDGVLAHSQEWQWLIDIIGEKAEFKDIAVYDAQRSPFCFRTAVFRSQRPPIFS